MKGPAVKRIACILLTALCLPVAAAAADAPRTWSTGVALRAGPLEPWPRAGIGVDAHYRLGRFRFGGEIDAWLPGRVGAVRRSGAAAFASLHAVAVDARWVAWYFGLGIGAALLYDNYDAAVAVADTRVVAPGFNIATGIEIRTTSFASPFIELRGDAFFSNGRAADDKWLCLGVGVRLDFDGGRPLARPDYSSTPNPAINPAEKP